MISLTMHIFLELRQHWSAEMIMVTKHLLLYYKQSEMIFNLGKRISDVLRRGEVYKEEHILLD